MENNVTVEYENTYTELQQHIFELRRLIKKRRKDFVKNGGHWGHVGDMKRIRSDVKDILNYLK
jgi:hypothetical protein